MATNEERNETCKGGTQAASSKRSRAFFTRRDSALERFQAAVASAAASVSHSFNHPASSSKSESAPNNTGPTIGNDDQVGGGRGNEQLQATQAHSRIGGSNTEGQQNEENNEQQINTLLRVPPSGYGGAVPRRPISRDSSAESSEGSTASNDTKTCFCGHYTEGSTRMTTFKRGRCKFCRSRAKYLPGQRSFDASKIFGRRRERGEPRRAASEDQSREGQGSSEGAAVSASQAQAASSTTSLDADLQPPRRPWRLKPSVRRQARLELDVPAPENVGDLGNATSPSRDHGLRTPPGPPVQLRPRRPTTLGEGGGSQRYATHLMASDMTGLLAPPSRTAALARAHTDPTSSCYENQPTPNSPPPTYEEVMKEPRVAPPSYEEALSTRMLTSLRIGPGGFRSLSEDRATNHPSPPPPFRGRNSSGNIRPLTRSSRVEEIPDIYWEQAARELDFCTCRKCQARYRQYFEEDLAAANDPNNDAEVMIPMETQVLMQEVLTDGMAFCSLM